MAQIPPITDAYIDEIIKAPDAYNPSLNKTQGVKLRELLKLMRDRMEQQSGGSTGSSGITSVTYQELISSMTLGTLIPGKQYLLTDYKTTWRISDGSLRKADDFEPLILLALTTSKLSTEAYSTIYPQDKIFYSVGGLDYDGNVEPYVEQNWSSLNGLIPETGFIYRRVDSFSNRDINFDFRGFWYGFQNSHSPLYFSNNVKINSGGLDSQYNRQPKILEYSYVNNSIVNVGSGQYGAANINSNIPETYEDLKIGISNSFVEILGTDITLSEVSFQNSNIKGIYLKNNMPSFRNVDNFYMNGYGEDISVYGNDAFTLLESDTVKNNVITTNNFMLQISWIGTNEAGIKNTNLSEYTPIPTSL